MGRSPSDFSRMLASATDSTSNSSSCHTTFHHRYQVCAEMGVTIVHGALSRDHVHMFVEIPPNVSLSDFVRRAKGRSSRKIQQEFEHIRKRYWGQRFWQRG